MKARSHNFIFLMIFLSFACGPKTNSALDPEEFNVVQDETLLNERLTQKEQVLAIETNENSDAKLLHDFLLMKKVEKPGFELTLVGELEPPVVEGNNVQSTDVIIKGNLAYVAYNVAGEMHRGAIDAIDISNLTKPKLISSIQFPFKDVNAIDVSGDKLYFAGAVNAEEPSYVSQVKLRSGSFLSQIDTVPLPGFAATDLVAGHKDIYIATGDNSGIHLFNLSAFTKQDFFEISDARAIAYITNEKSIWALSGTPGKAYHFDGNFKVDRQYELGGADIAESKSTLQLGKKWGIAALGTKGTTFYCLKDGTEILTIPQVQIPELARNLTVTNAATSSQSFLFTASGEAGVYAYRLSRAKNKDKDTCDGLNYKLVGSVNFGQGLSANHITFNGKYVFVADGLGGLKILTFKKVQSDDDDEDVDDFDHDDD